MAPQNGRLRQFVLGAVAFAGAGRESCGMMDRSAETMINRRLHYPGTDIEIRLGDRIEYRKIFGGRFGLFGKKKGTVVYVPGDSPKNRWMESDEYNRNWAIQLDGEDSQIVYPYFPEQEWVSRRIRFLSRGEPIHGVIGPDDNIWGDDPEEPS